MRVGIIGAGFTGLSAALKLVENGIDVEVYDFEKFVGGLASGFSLPDWDWSVERFYHHIFSNDDSIIRLAKKIDWEPIFFRPTTAVYFNGNTYPFDTPLHLLRFPHLSFQEKLRMGAVLGFLKANPWWRPLERLRAEDFLSKTMGKSGFQKIWEPLLKAKFGPLAHEVNAAWFWTRIKKRTSRLGYFERGFQGLADKVRDSVIEGGGSVLLNNRVQNIRTTGKQLEIISKKSKKRFDRVLITTNIPAFLGMVEDLPTQYRKKLLDFRSLDALVVVLVLRKQLKENPYWINISDRKMPFVVVVEHTKMIDAKYYAGNHIVYLGAYLPRNHKHFTLSKAGVADLALDQLKTINPNFNKKNLLKSFVFKAKEAQPVITLNYSSKILNIRTPIKNLYLGNMNMVYPWDRQANYAVELGERIAKIILYG